MNLSDISITIDTTYIYEVLEVGNPLQVIWKLLGDGGWLVFVPIFIMAGWRTWVNWRQALWSGKQKPILLALDIPKDNEQSPKAVEHIFSHLWGIYSSGNLIDKYWDGRYQLPFSLEIVGNSGYIQFYIYTFDSYRDIVEAAVYAQYPNAIITEVEDYAQAFKGLRFPNTDYKVWGTEMKFTKKDAYPIRTYVEFEHSLSQELKDPMASVLELLGRLKPREHVWIQLVATPIKGDWGEGGDKIVKKMLGTDSGPKRSGLVQAVGDAPLTAISLLNKYALFGSSAESAKADKVPAMQKMSPGEVDTIKAIQNKMSKAAFSTVFRVMYLSPPSVYSKYRGISGVMGSLNQFNSITLNSVVKDGKRAVDIDYFFEDTRKDWRRRLLLRKYLGRSTDGTKIILNTEELATLYHFPVMLIKPTLLSTVEAKRVEPPTYLPSDRSPFSTAVELTSAPQKTKPSQPIFAPEQSFEGVGEGIPWDLLGDIDQKGDSQQVKTASQEIADLDNNMPNFLDEKPEDIISEVPVDDLVAQEDGVKKQGQAPSNLPFVIDR